MAGQGDSAELESGHNRRVRVRVWTMSPGDEPRRQVIISYTSHLKATFSDLCGV